MEFDCDPYVIEVKLRDNVSDGRFDSIMSMKPTIKEFKSFQKKLLADHPVFSEKAESSHTRVSDDNYCLFRQKYRDEFYHSINERHQSGFRRG